MSRLLRRPHHLRQIHHLAPNEATPLAKHLHSQILFSGPITVANYMRQCLTHPTLGYYTTKEQVFGSAGDFVTSPQISPVFSELIAVFIAHYLSQRSSTLTNYRLVELGPGDALLQQALLPALARLKCKPVSLSLADASHNLQNKQKQALDSLPRGIVPNTNWHVSADSVLSALDEEDAIDKSKNKCVKPTIFIAHEFFDALPVHVFQRTEMPDTPTSPSPWRELLVDADTKPVTPLSVEEKSGALRLVVSRVPTPASALLPLLQPPPSPSESTVEICPSALSISRRLAARAQIDSGLSLIIDYGGMLRRGLTARSVARHQHKDILTSPGTVDLTADVDFGAIRAAATESGEATWKGAITQRDFLLRLGLAQRMRVLGKNLVEAGGDKKEVDQKLGRLQQDYNRLVGEQEGDMGNVYKVAAICAPGVGSLAGFE